jgi:hypothetical protein
MSPGPFPSSPSQYGTMSHRHCTPWQLSKMKSFVSRVETNRLPTFPTLTMRDLTVPFSPSDEHLHGFDVANHHIIPHAGSTDDVSGRDGVSHSSESGRCGVSHVPKATTPSSNRQKAAFMKSAVTTQLSSRRSKQNKAKRGKRKAMKQEKDLFLISLPPQVIVLFKQERVFPMLFYLLMVGIRPTHPSAHWFQLKTIKK